MVLKLIVNEVVVGTEQEVDKTPVKIECWYDRHYRHWVLYPVDKNGYQWVEARYAFGKKEAMETKAEMEKEYGIK